MWKFTCFSVLTGSFMLSSAAAGELSIAAYTDNVPFAFVDGAGTLSGFEIDLVKLLAKRMGKTPNFTSMPFNSLFNAVQSGRADVAMGTVAVTKQRLGSVSFTQPYFDSNQCVVTSSRSTIVGLSDLAGKVLSVVTGSTGEIWATANQKEMGVSEVRRYDSTNEALLDIATGRVSAYVYDCPSAAYYIKDKPSFSIVATIPTVEQFAFMVSKNSPILGELNSAIAELKKSGEIAALYEKWLGIKAEEASSTVSEKAIPNL
ncbi:ABC transporter substrate-binding protein [Agrobacterium sp. NPDC089420]|uniref:ABC transporter substrate-binding protein n=1 Tax=Agrobacterium sp. NPDC089420 TaxID=3363918 RepID=UPI00384D5498